MGGRSKANEVLKPRWCAAWRVVATLGLGLVCMGRPVRLDQFYGFDQTGSIEYAGHLGTLGLNGAGDDPVDFMPTGDEDL
ncbi:hypothetical protein F511_06589 [Dorcoceras hygrometricum]|uniref:Uncharacterized protein n=1 Tax=Dorcoceras hygrometricum TaxID=472368 RepID=A0A2Z7BBB5_9LAMI|nr:hypothetical protein F511_06589 [Dorcoceras hygrometricum]